MTTPAEVEEGYEMEATNEEWISIETAAREINCSRENIRARIKAKAFVARPEQVGDARLEWRISRTSFNKWKEQRVENSRRGKRLSSDIRGRQLAASPPF